MEEAAVCLRSQGIEDSDGGIGRIRLARGLNDDSGGVGGGRGIDNVSEGLETTTEAAALQ